MVPIEFTNLCDPRRKMTEDQNVTKTRLKRSALPPWPRRKCLMLSRCSLIFSFMVFLLISNIHRISWYRIHTYMCTYIKCVDWKSSHCPNTWIIDSDLVKVVIIFPFQELIDIFTAEEVVEFLASDENGVLVEGPPVVLVVWIPVAATATAYKGLANLKDVLAEERKCKQVRGENLLSKSTNAIENSPKGLRSSSSTSRLCCWCLWWWLLIAETACSPILNASLLKKGIYGASEVEDPQIMTSLTQ